MNKTDRPNKSSPKVFSRGIFLFCGLLLALADAAERSAGNNSRHALLEETGVRARRAEFDISSKNILR